MLKPHERNNHFRFSSKNQTRREKEFCSARDVSPCLQSQNITVTSAAEKCPHSILSHTVSKNPSLFHPPLSSRQQNPLTDFGELSLPCAVTHTQIKQIIRRIRQWPSHGTMMQIVCLLGCQKKQVYAGSHELVMRQSFNLRLGARVKTRKPWGHRANNKTQLPSSTTTRRPSITNRLSNCSHTHPHTPIHT